MRTKSRSTGAEGFTLIEVMITMFLLSFITASLAMVSMYAQRSGIHARRLTSANMVAERSLEQYRNIVYIDLPGLHNDETCYDAYMADAVCGTRSEIFKRTTLVTQNTPVAEVTKIDVTVTWEENMTWEGMAQADLEDPTSQDIKVVSYISKY